MSGPALEVTGLACEHQAAPLGIDEPRPRFSWKLASVLRDVVQHSYRIQLSSDFGFTGVLWDTGVVLSEDSVFVEYMGPALKSCTRYFWRVQAEDARGNESAWSEPAFFETAFFSRSEWEAAFISPQDEEAGSSRGMRLRREFLLDGEVASARVYATALGLYELSLNGAPVGDAVLTPGWTSYHKRLLYQTYDVAGMLASGPNAAGATLAGGWYKGDLGWVGQRNLYGARTALLFQLVVRYSDGRTGRIVSDKNWKSAESPMLFSELYHGETYDARLSLDGWDKPGFDDSRWKPVVSVPHDLGLLKAQDGPPVTRQEVLPCRSILVTPRGERVLDFGQNIAGRVRFRVRGQSGQKVVLRHAEVLDAAGNFYTENLRSARARVEYVLKGDGVETFEPHFTFHGFRYALVEEHPGVPSASDFTAVVLHSRIDLAGAFECSHDLLNKLHHNVLWSWKGNAVDVPTDCPQRDERLGWTGDAQVFARTACFLTQAAGFYRKWLRDLAADQRPDGGVPFVVPDVLTDIAAHDPMMRQTHSSCGWGDAAVICPWTVYEFYGDRRILEGQYGSMKGWVEYIRAHAQDGVLWNTGFHFGDWVALDAKEGSYFGATPNDLVATAFYARSTLLLSRAAAALGKNDEADEYLRLSERIAEAFRAEFFTPSGRLAARTQTAHVLALAFDLVPERHRRRCVDTLQALLNENGGHLTTGFLGTPHICRALSDNGRLEEAYALLLKEDFPSWLYQVKQGATTIWEHWDGIKPDGTMWSPKMNSFNHYAYGAVGEWLHGVVAGLDSDPQHPCWKRMIVHPRPGGGLTWAKASHETPFGRASVAWKKEKGWMTVEVLVPPNASARVILEGASAGEVKAEDARVSASDAGATAVIGSGRRVFSWPINP
jgi:alpha-L-rhamnosidase